MIISITLNPCIDKTIYLDELKVGGYNRVKSTRTDLAGKGINVSTVLHNLGEETICTGFCFKSNGHMLEKVLNERGLKSQFIAVEGEIRTNIKLFNQSCHVMTEINEAGSYVSTSAVNQLMDKVNLLLDDADILVMSGSIPPGVPVDIYQSLIRMARSKGVKTVLDAAGKPLLLGIQENPFLIKPNDFEFEQAFDKELKSGMSPIEVARRAVKGGISYICISMGADGAILVDREHVYRAKPLAVEARGLTGAGDSLVAGMCHAIVRQLGSVDMLRYAMAAAAGSVRQDGTLLAQEKDVKELLPRVKIEMIE